MLRRRVERLPQRALEALSHAGLVNDSIVGLLRSRILSWHNTFCRAWEGHLPKLDPQEVIGYYRALVEFVDLFADVEGVLFLYLYTLVGVDEATAKAVFSGVRVHEAYLL
jgi:hypothetical protein